MPNVDNANQGKPPTMNETKYRYLPEHASSVVDSIAVREFVKLLRDPPEPILTSQELELRVQRVMDRIEADERRDVSDVSTETGVQDNLPSSIRVTVHEMRKYVDKLQQLLFFEIENSIEASAVRGRIENSPENVHYCPVLDERLHRSDWILLEVKPEGPCTYRCVLKLNGHKSDVPPKPRVQLTVGDDICDVKTITVDADGFLEFLFKTDARWVADKTTSVEFANGKLGVLFLRIMRHETETP